MIEHSSPVAPQARRWTFEVHSLGFIVGAAATVALLFSLHALSLRILPPEGAEMTFLAMYLLLPGILPALAALVLWSRLPRLRRTMIMALKGALAAEAAVIAAFVLTDAFPLAAPPLVYGPPGAKSSLMSASSFDMAREPQPGPLSTWTADELNRRGRGQPYREITYVTADVPSTSALIVSVNPISDTGWGAAALSPRGHCYLIFTSRRPLGPPGLGVKRYGVLPPGEPCVGSAANGITVQESSWPPGHY